MSIFDPLFDANGIVLHRTVLIRGTLDEALRTELESRHSAIPIIVRFGRIGIDDIRSIKKQLVLKDDENQGVIVYGEAITREAQNALLKILEDASRSRSLVMVVPESAHILPTVLSRCMTLRIGTRFLDEKRNKEIEKFFAKDIAGRVSAIDRLIKKDNGKDLARELLLDIAVYFDVHKGPVYADAKKSFATFQPYVMDVGFPIKAALFHIASLVPESANA